MPNRSPTWKKFALAASSLVLTVGLLELCAHGWDYAQYGTRRTDGQPVGLYIRDGSPEPRLKPGARLSGLRFQVSVNQHGLRGPERVVPKPADTVRVWCVGGSTTFDIFASDDAHTWPAVAERHLRDRVPGMTVEVLNGGVPGDILEGSSNKLHTLGRRLGVDYVLVYHGPNDLRAIAGGHLAAGSGPPVPLRSLELLQTWAFGRGIGTGDLPARPPTRHEHQLMESRLQRLERTAQGLQATVLYATHAARMTPDATGAALRVQTGELAAQLQMSPASARDWYDTWNALMQSRATMTRTPLVDVRSAVGPDAHLWGDATHFSDAGSELAGQAVADALAPFLSRRGHTLKGAPAESP